MPKGPKGEKRPADVIGAAVHVMRIATGEIEEDIDDKPAKSTAAAELGRMGGQACQPRPAYDRWALCLSRRGRGGVWNGR